MDSQFILNATAAYSQPDFSNCTHYQIIAAIKKPAFSAGLSGLSYGSGLAFLTLFLFGQFFAPFFSVDENVVRVFEVLFPALSCFAVLAPVLKFKIMQV